jgi:C-terminal processing protease CtpA/Prc
MPPSTDPSSESGPSPVEILEALWKALQDHYPMLDYVGAHGDEWLEEFRPKVSSAPDTQAAYRLMDELVCRLNDYHTRLRWPGQPPEESPPLRAAWVFKGSPSPAKGVAYRPLVGAPHEPPRLEGYALAVAQADAGTGLKPGDEIETIDGRPALAALAEAWKRSVGSTLDAKLQAAAWKALRGAPDQPVRLGIRTEGNSAVRNVEVPRSGFPSEPTVSRRIVREVAVIRIARWVNSGEEDLAAEFDRLLEERREDRALVIDVRGNGGGDDGLADRITGRFLSQPVISSVSFHRQTPDLTFRRTIEWAPPRGPWRFEGRFAVLTDSGCKSACEHFVSGMAEAGALLCGTPTDGACGWIRSMDLPGGATINVSRTFPLHAGGIPSPMLGIAPHLLRPLTLGDLRQGRDAALDAALHWLQSRDPLPPRVQLFAD